MGDENTNYLHVSIKDRVASNIIHKLVNDVGEVLSSEQDIQIEVKMII